MSNEPEYEPGHRSATFRPELITQETRKKMERDRKRIEAEIEGQGPLSGAVETVCEHLPEGWSIDLCMEQGSAVVRLYDPEGGAPEDFDDYYDDTYTLAERVLNALAFAKISVA